ncbi:hypothetical protein EXIGLDRAFT_846294 [Exidia glandulosa HHB12029]|uniref:F-box domain-containing protein n=1 Tax=Exidia glandulosa HHB12029 TaxID=1314781 RepID=A0A165B250_EXIGL|nr:hypothetical protein EXIGLDRAFT_846294 [Exidia glandulosa HHB12029]
MRSKTRRDPNRYATGIEYNAVCARLPDEVAELELLQGKHQRAQAALHDAQARFREIEAQHLLHKDVLADAEAYAHETTRRRDAQEKVSYEDFESMRRRQLQPLRLAAVCKRWRQVAMTASPRLWRYVDIDTSKNARNQPKISLLHTTRVLTRSGSTLLNIRLVRPFPGVEQEDADLLSNLAGVMHRCRSFIFVGPLYDAAARLTNLLQTSTPRLEELLLNGLTASPANVQVHHVRGIRLFPDAPLLRSMVAVSSFGFRTEFPFLTAAALHGSISSTEQDDIAYLLGNSPGLNELAIYNPVFAVSTRGQVVAPNVEVLTVRANHESPVHFLAQRYIFSGLKGLHLYGSYNGSNLRVRYLAAVATTSSLTHVTVTDLLAADLGFACTVVNGLNFLESLMIIRSSFAAETLQALCDALTRVAPPKSLSGNGGGRFGFGFGRLR